MNSPAPSSAGSSGKPSSTKRDGGGEPREPTDGVIRRTRRRPFVPPTQTDDSPAVSRELLSRTKIGKPQLSRNRKIAGDLPDWDPLPPGEISVQRGGSRHSRD